MVMSLVPALCSLFSLLWAGGMLAIIWQTPGVLLIFGLGLADFVYIAREIIMLISLLVYVIICIVLYINKAICWEFLNCVGVTAWGVLVYHTRSLPQSSRLGYPRVLFVST